MYRLPPLNHKYLTSQALPCFIYIYDRDFFVIILLKMWRRPKFYSEELKQINKHPLKDYILEQTAQAYKKVESLESVGSKLEKEDIGQLARFFFELGNGSYIGVESSLPSTYYELYPSYLKNNELYLKRLGDKDKSATKRILITRSGGEIRTNAIIHPQSYKDFIEWHHKNHMGLYWIEKDRAEEIMKQLSLDATDIGLWSNSFAITFTPSNHKNIHIKLTKKKSSAFREIENYVQKISEAAHPLSLDVDNLPIFSEAVVERWEGYIGSYEFRKIGIGKVFKNEFSQNSNWSAGRILDAAAGSGYETLLLSEQGYDVTANEVDPVWNEILRKKLSVSQAPVEVYQHDWRELSTVLKPLYSGIVAVGNSLCMVIGKDQRRKSIQEFYNVLKPGGKLIVDERNFERILKLIKTGKSVFSKGAMYACDKMNGQLSLEDDDERLIRFSFFDVKSKKVLGSTVVQAPGKNELVNIMKAIGFKDIKIYSDLKLGRDENCGIFTYVGTK